MESQGEILGYCVISKGGGRYSFASKNDIVVGPYFVLREHRGNRFSEIMIDALLHDLEITYKYAYAWIKKDNIPSIKCCEKLGFKIVNSANLSRFIRRICVCNDDSGDYWIYKYERIK